MVMRALNVWTSSAKIGCLYCEPSVPNRSKRALASHGHTLSCQPRRTVRICGPMCRRCSSGRVSLETPKLRRSVAQSLQTYALAPSRLGGSVSTWARAARRLRDGDIPMLVAFLMLIASSDSCLHKTCQSYSKRGQREAQGLLGHVDMSGGPVMGHVGRAVSAPCVEEKERGLDGLPEAHV
jgi:hypothetical protein